MPMSEMNDAEVLRYIYYNFCCAIGRPQPPYAPRGPPDPNRSPSPPPTEWPLNYMPPQGYPQPNNKLIQALTEFSFNQVPDEALACKVRELTQNALQRVKHPKQRPKHQVTFLLNQYANYLSGIDVIDRWKLGLVKELAALRGKLGPVLPLYASIVVRIPGRRFSLPLEIQDEIFSYLNAGRINEVHKKRFSDSMTVAGTFPVENPDPRCFTIQTFVKSKHCSAWVQFQRDKAKRIENSKLHTGWNHRVLWKSRLLTIDE